MLFEEKQEKFFLFLLVDENKKIIFAPFIFITRRNLRHEKRREMYRNQ